MLSEERRREIAEEEKYRKKIKAREESKRALIWLAVIIVFVIMVIALASSDNSGSNNKATTPTAEEKTAQKEKMVSDLTPICVQNHKSIYKPKINELLTSSTIAYQSTSLGAYTTDECQKIITGLYNLGYPKSEIQKVAEAKYWIGMDARELFFSVGLPSDSNSTTTAFVSSVQLIYGDPLNHATYIYLDNGKVTTYQN